jgi:sulfite exporter TauE/SafE/copper chaperone CopZ
VAEPHSTVVYVQGMTCAACEQRVGKALRRIPGVQQVSVSARKGQAVITSAGEIDRGEISKAVKKAGYLIGRTKEPWLTADSKVWIDVAVAAGAVIALALAANKLGLFSFADSLTAGAASGNLVFVALLGVAASVSTCMALVGGVVISLSASFAEAHPDATTAQRLRPQLMFNAGRIVGFGLLGGVLGAIGSTFTMSGPVLAILMLAVAVVMGLLGLRLTGISPRLAGTSFTLPSSLANLVEAKGGYRDWTGLALGAASFFLPCAFTQSVQVYALSTGDPLTAALTMSLFALGTAPGLMGVGSVSTLIKTDRFFHYVGVVVIAFAVLNASGAAAILAPAQTVTTPTATARTSNVVDEGGRQLATIQVSHGYAPHDTVIYAGETTQLNFDVQNLDCSSSLNVTKLGVNDLIFLNKGSNLVDISLAAPGVYPYSCGMGMYTGTITAIAR